MCWTRTATASRSLSRLPKPGSPNESHGLKPEAVAITYAPHGCTCSPNQIQPRCAQHLMRAWDSEEELYIVEDFVTTTNDPGVG
jgi:hypothetical protein